jgi:hypothetical protein
MNSDKMRREARSEESGMRKKKKKNQQCQVADGERRTQQRVAWSRAGVGLGEGGVGNMELNIHGGEYIICTKGIHIIC